MFKKSRRTALLAISLMIASAVPIIAVPNAQAALPDTVHLTVHYQRSAGDYPNWNIYLWRDLPGSANDKVANGHLWFFISGQCRPPW